MPFIIPISPIIPIMLLPIPIPIPEDFGSFMLIPEEGSDLSPMVMLPPESLCPILAIFSIPAILVFPDIPFIFAMSFIRIPPDESPSIPDMEAEDCSCFSMTRTFSASCLSCAAKAAESGLAVSVVVLVSASAGERRAIARILVLMICFIG